MANGGTQEQWFTVIGVAPDIKHDDIDPDDQPFSAAYVPFHFQQMQSIGLTIRVDGDPASVIPGRARGDQGSRFDDAGFAGADDGRGAAAGVLQGTDCSAGFLASPESSGCCWRPSVSTACCRTSSLQRTAEIGVRIALAPSGGPCCDSLSVMD